METVRKHIRRDFAPLTVSVSMACSTTGSPVTQVYNAEEGEWEPDRSVTPTVLQPVVHANAADGSWPTPSANSELANMKWYANGVDISTIAAWNGKYSIDTVGSTRGAITIARNINPGEVIALHFEAELVDNRLGMTHAIKTDPVILSTVDKSFDSYGISIGEGTSVWYNPFLDLLYRYEYKVAYGKISASPAAQSAATDKNSYLRTIPINVYKGADIMTSGYTVKLFRVNNQNSFTELSTGDEILAISTSAIQLDLRLITKANYMIIAYVGNTEVARIQFSVARLYQDFSCSPTNDSAILPTQSARYDVASVESEGKVVECPEAIIAITWYTDSAYKTAVQHNEGGHTIFELSKTGVGSTHTDDWLEIYMQSIQKEAHCIAIDENGDTLVDENGDTMIFN